MGVAMGGMVPPHFQSIGQAMAIIGAVIIFWYAGREKSGIFSKIISGFLALYGSTSYLGDILSYSRLLALGFGSAVIGMIINLLGGMDTVDVIASTPTDSSDKPRSEQKMRTVYVETFGQEYPFNKIID